VLQSQTSAMHLIATVHRKKSTRFVIHITEIFSDESSCEVEIEKKAFLVLNSNDNGT